ncbi:sugar phosphate isomerase/epimerase [Ferrimonas balearica]|nr:sugar phosphate isomerase/epimerase [Ferrimonas balearica]
MTLPVIGAALMVPELATYRDWLFEKNRDLEIQSFADPALLASGDWQPLVDEAKRQLDGFAGRHGIHGPFWGLSFANPDPEIRAVVTRRMAQGLDICEALGGSHMVIHSPFTTWDHHNLSTYPGGLARVTDWVHESLGAAVTRAENAGITLVLENIEDVDPEARKELVQSFGSEALKLSIDTGHAHYAHGSTGAQPVDYFVRSAGDLLGHVHLQDADGYADRHWSIGEGTIRWPEVFRAIAATGANPRLILELRNRADIPRSMAWLESRGLGQ